MSPKGELLEINDIIRDRIKKDGSMEFLVSWKGYDSDYDSWEPVSSFEGGGLTLSEWLEQTSTTVPKATNIEMVVADVEEGGYIVKCKGRPKDEHEWLPEEMIPDYLLDEFDAREEDLEGISDDAIPIQTAATTRRPGIGVPAAHAVSATTTAPVVTTAPSPIAAQSAAMPRAAITSSPDQTQLNVSQTTKPPDHDSSEDVEMEEAQSTPAETENAQDSTATLAAQNEGVTNSAAQDAEMLGADDFVFFDPDFDPNFDYETAMADFHQPGLCTDQLPPGHVNANETEECRDVNHDRALSKVSCHKCVAKAHSYLPQQNRGLYEAGITVYLHPKCNEACEKEDGLGHLCNCRTLPRCSLCHMRTVRKFREKADEMAASGAAAVCVRCKEALQVGEQVFARCAVCVGRKH